MQLKRLMLISSKKNIFINYTYTCDNKSVNELSSIENKV